jgi:hypothetical protein
LANLKQISNFQTKKFKKIKEKMIFQSIENLLLIGTIFIVHKFLKNKPSFLYPLTGVPFLRLVKKEDAQGEKKLTKKLNLKGQ